MRESVVGVLAILSFTSIVCYVIATFHPPCGFIAVPPVHSSQPPQPTPISSHLSLDQLRIAAHLTFYHAVDGSNNNDDVRDFEFLFHVVETLWDVGARQMDVFIHTNNESSPLWWTDVRWNLFVSRPLPRHCSVQIVPHDL